MSGTFARERRCDMRGVTTFSLSLCATALGALALPRESAAQGVAAMESSPLVCPVDETEGQPLALGRAVLGAQACFACHSQGTSSYAIDPEVIRIVGSEFLNRAVHDNWVLGNEFVTWGGQDRHAQAYTTLLGERSQRMGKTLGIADVSRDVRCLACHASVPAASLQHEGFTLEASYFAGGRTDSRISQGVSCEACHGAAGAAADAGRAGWIDVHVAKDTWRYLAPDEKQSAHGFYDVRTPSSRMRLCLSCHLGDADQGRLVTHAMYAAGHPPLPGFELKSFADMLPPHWRELGGGEAAEPPRARPETLLGKKPGTITTEFLGATADPYFKGLREKQPEYFASIVDDYGESFAASRSIAVGALVACAENAALTKALASESNSPLLPAEGRWPELAQFECAACHHELRDASWRQRQPRIAAPGRPLLRDWSSPLARAVVAALASDEAASLDGMLRQVQQAGAAKPFGDADALAPLLSLVEQRLNDQATLVESQPFTRTDALALLRSVAQVGSESALEYDAARQLVWAFREVLDEVDSQGAWTAVRGPLNELEQSFVLDLAARGVRRKVQIETPGDTRDAFEIDLAQVLPRLAEHAAESVRKSFEELADVVAADPP
jgi:hypothetical protein